MTKPTLTIEPVTAERWDDLARLFGPRGAVAGCWCMWFRQTGAEFDRKRGAANRNAMRAFVRKDTVPGLIAYADGEPAGWVSVAPRAEYARIERSRTLAPVDDKPAWAVVCFFIHRAHRGNGVGQALLRAAVDHAAARGARIVEGYPIDPRGEVPPIYAYYGTVSMFRNAGFREVARRGKRPIMRKTVRPRTG